MTVSPSMPTGISDPLASTTISWAVSTVRPCPPRAAQKLNGLPGVVHCDGDDAERPGVEPRPAAERCTVNNARTAIGVAITAAKASHLSTPRWAGNQYAPAATRHAPTAPTATMATLPRLAKPITTAASRSTKADRASLRRCGPLAARRIAAGGGSRCSHFAAGSRCQADRLAWRAGQMKRRAGQMK